MITVPLVSSRYFEELYKDFYHNTNSFTCLVSSILSQLWEFSTVAFSRVYINYYIPQVKGKGKYKNLDTFVKADIRELWKNELHWHSSPCLLSFGEYNSNIMYAINMYVYGWL